MRNEIIPCFVKNKTYRIKREFYISNYEVIYRVYRKIKISTVDICLRIRYVLMHSIYLRLDIFCLRKMNYPNNKSP